MKAAIRKVGVVLLCWVALLQAASQEPQARLVNMMLELEASILDAYLEYQKLYYEDKSRMQELRAFEDLLSVYIDQVMQIYETLSLAERETQVPRDIAARTLIFKALMFLEKAPLNIEYYEYACYEYYKALELYKKAEDVPVIYKELPRHIQTGNTNYYRLIDLLEDKGQGLKEYGKVNITFKDFKVTANFNPQMIEVVQIRDPAALGADYTFDMAEPRIIEAFAEVFRRNTEVKTYVALPAGTYILRLKEANKGHYTALTTLYVRANQEQDYFMEPLGDWVILYEKPQSRKPDFYKFRRNNELLEGDAISELESLEGLTNGSTSTSKTNGRTSGRTAKHVDLVEEIVQHYFEALKIEGLLGLAPSQTRTTLAEDVAAAVVEYVESPRFFNDWSLWTASWRIATEVRDGTAPGYPVPTELVKVIHQILRQI